MPHNRLMEIQLEDLEYQRRAIATVVGVLEGQPLYVITFICEGGPEYPKASGSSRPSKYCTRPC